MVASVNQNTTHMAENKAITAPAVTSATLRKKGKMYVAITPRSRASFDSIFLAWKGKTSPCYFRAERIYTTAKLPIPPAAM